MRYTIGKAKVRRIYAIKSATLHGNFGLAHAFWARTVAKPHGISTKAEPVKDSMLPSGAVIFFRDYGGGHAEAYGE